MPTVLPLFALLTSLAAHPHHTPIHHPHGRPHHAVDQVAGPKLVPPAPPPASAGAKAADANAVEDIETVDTLDLAAPSAAQGQSLNPVTGGVAKNEHVFGVAPDFSAKITTPAGAAAAMGHMHAALVHLPIAWVLLWAIIECISFIRPKSSLHPSALFLGFVSLASFLPAVLSGLCRLDELTSATKGYDTAEALLHRNLIFVGAGVCGICLVVRLIHWRWPKVFFRLISLMGVVSACAIISYSAHLGGRLVYGADFLPW